MGRGLRAAALLAVGAIAAESSSRAQDELTDGPVIETSSPAADQGVRVFEPSFFETFNPITAFDMVAQVPGFTIDDGDDRRGFGANAGNVLINGERPSSTSQVSDELGRIAADRVLRIELLRGAQSDADVRGQTELVNVVLRASDERQAATYVAEANIMDGGGRVGWFAQATQALRLFGADVTFDVQLPSDTEREHTDELVTTPDGAVILRRDEFFQPNFREIRASASARWRPTERDAASLNLRVQPKLWDGDELSIVTDADGAPLSWESGWSEDTDAIYAEIGGDWERTFTPTLSAKVIGLVTHDQVTANERFDTVTPAGFDSAELAQNVITYGERIGRGTATWRGLTDHTLEAGVEGAFTFRETDLDVAIDRGAGPEPIDLRVAATRVEELRGEAYVTDVWTVSERLSLESGLTFEASRISQTGDAEQEREFTYPKPRAIATYAASSNDQLRLSIVRDVGQLDFQDFASSVSFGDNTVNLGNPDLEPERAWQTRAEWERRLGARSAVTIAAFYDAVEAVSDLVVTVVDDDGPGDGDLDGDDGILIFSGPGNLGDGTRWGGEINGSAALDFLGLRNAVLRYEGVLQHTSVDDSLTLEPRAFVEEPEWEYRFEFRHDLPERRFAWGFDYGQTGEIAFHRANELRTNVQGAGNFDAFIETTRWGGVTLRLGVDNLFDAVETTERLFFVDSRASGVIDAQELRDVRSGQVYTIRVAGAF